MRRKYSLISLVVVFIIAAVIAFAALPPAQVVVRKPLARQARISPAFIEVKAGTNDETSSTDLLLESAIVDILARIGESRTAEKSDAIVVVECRYRLGFCLPYLGRHMNTMSWTSPNWIQLTMRDNKTTIVIGQVEFRRPPAATRPSLDVLQRMIDALRSSG